MAAATNTTLVLGERFWSKVDKTGKCWVWTSARIQRGVCDYGRYFINGRGRSAHRLAYEEAKGKVPEGLELDHLCRNTLCVNPDHLQAVTHKVNMLRGKTIFAAELQQTHCKNGHELTPDNCRPDRLKLGERVCMTCQREHTKKWYESKGREYYRNYHRERRKRLAEGRLS